MDYSEETSDILKAIYELDISGVNTKSELKEHLKTAPLHIKENARKQYWQDLVGCVKVLESVDYKRAIAYMNAMCENDKNEIINDFKFMFDGVKNDDPLKRETLVLLGRLGIIIF